MSVRDIEFDQFHNANLKPWLRITDIPSVTGVDLITRAMHNQNMPHFMPETVDLRNPSAWHGMPSKTWNNGLVPTMSLTNIEVIILKANLSIAKDSTYLDSPFTPTAEFAGFAQTLALTGDLYLFSKGGIQGRFRRDYTIFVGDWQNPFDESGPQLVIASRVPKRVRDVSDRVLVDSWIGLEEVADQQSLGLRHPSQGGLVSPR